jgi:hypothetical protein
VRTRRGLRGTGSNDIAVHDLFVEEERSFSFQDQRLVKRAGPLYAFPFMFTAKGAAPALGVARSAIDAFVERAAGKPARRYTIGEAIEAPKAVRDDVFVQEAVGRAETQLAAARAYYFEVMGDLWNTLLDGEQPSERQVALFTSTYTHVVRACVDVVQLIYKGGRRHSSLPKGAARSLPARCFDDEPACGRNAANLRNVGSPVARPPAPSLALLVCRFSVPPAEIQATDTQVMRKTGWPRPIRR